MSRYIKVKDRVLEKEYKVIPYSVELIILQKLLETRDVSITSQETQNEIKTVLQVATKYYDTIKLIIDNTDTAKIIEKSYSNTLDKALKANEKIVDLLSRQVNILWKEYTSPNNDGVLMKDYLIQQIMMIQDKLSKIIDRNDVNYKANREYLLKQLRYSSKAENPDETDSTYSENVESVFNMLKKKDDEILAVSRKKSHSSGNPNIPKNAYIFDICKKLDDGTFTEVKHYNSCQACADDFPELSVKAIQTACLQRYKKNTRTFRFKGIYLIQNLKRGDEL